MTEQSRLLTAGKAIFIISIVGYCLFYFTRFEHFLGWEIVSSIDPSAFTVSSFVKGPFELNLVGTRYLVEENFVGSEVKDTSALGWALMAVCWLGIAYLLALSTYFKRYFFLLCCGVVLLFALSLGLDGINAWDLGEGSRASTAIIFLAFTIPAYLFQAYYTGTSLLIRAMVFVLIILGLVGSLHLTSGISLTYLQAGTNTGFAILALVFVFLISEEIVFGVLQVVTQGNGKGNEKHFILISLIYLGFVLLYFLKKAGIYEHAFAFLDPYILLIVSCAVSLWTFQYKQITFTRTFGVDLDYRHFVFALGVVFSGYLSMGFVAGNDPLYESFHYTITYSHLAFGFIFLIYIIANFIDALIDGHAVYRIAYKDRNFPYATAKLVGFIGCVAFFLMANKEPLELTQAAKLNFLGDHYLVTEQHRLAEEYYLQASYLGYNSHYSNYQLGLLAKAKNDFSGAEARFKLSTNRYPTEQAYINAASYLREEENASAVGLLEYASTEFENSGEIVNNLANRLASQGRVLEAKELLSSAPKTGSWNDGPQVNLFRIEASSDQPFRYQQLNLENSALKANVIYSLMGKKIDTNEIDLNMEQEPFGLHDLALINNGAYFPSTSYSQEIYELAISSVYNTELHFHLKLARFFDLFQSGHIDQSISYLQGLIYQAEGVQKGELLNLKGLIQLKHGLLEEAVVSFGESLQNGFRHAALNEAICSLELGDWSQARVLWSDLVKTDPTYAGYLSEIEPVFDESERVDTFVNLYYRSSRLSISDLNAALNELRLSPREVNTLWTKLSLNAIRNWDPQSFTEYLALFTPVLSTFDVNEAQSQLRILLGGDSPYESKIIAYEPVNTIGQIRRLKKTDLLEAYQSMVDVVRLNPNQIIYHQELVLLATELGLSEYADQSLDVLNSLMTPLEFNTFKETLPEPKAF